MSTKPTLLILGRQQAIMNRVVPLVEAAGFRHLAAITDEEAKEKFSFEVDAVVFGGGVETTSVLALTGHFKNINPAVITHQHAGGPHGFQELLAQLKQEIISKPKP